MGIRRSDRYVLREMIGPFLISLFGLLLFIVLNLILSLSDLMVDRGVGILTLLKLLVLKLPNLLVLALPVSGLFATFLGLGRLVHDREVIALEAAGISLRRILLPLLLAALFVGLADFALYNWAVPSSEHGYQRVLRGIIFRQGTPHIRANTFFKGPEGQFFYVRSVDEKDGSLRGVLVYDVEGRVFPQAQAAITLVTAEEGRWREQEWDLIAGRVYGYDREGELVYVGAFDELHVAIDRSQADVLAGSQTPAEMGIGELRSRMAVLRRSGLPIDELVVESHLRGAIPLAAVVFVLFGGSASLLWGWRSRAVGVVVSLLLVGLFQGTLLWTQTLGRRGVLAPSLAAWIPDVLFGLVGLLLFLRLDRLGWGNLRCLLRRVLPFLFALVLIPVLAGATVSAQDSPVEIQCDALSVSSDRDHLSAHGAVRVTYGETRLAADELALDRDEGGTWQLVAAGNVELAVGSDFTVSGEAIAARLEERGDSVVALEATATGFHGRSLFTNSRGEQHALVYGGADGRIEFDRDGNVATLVVTEAEMTTCECCGGDLRAQPYSIKTRRLLVYPDRLVVAFDLTVRSVGVPIFWLPVYVQPLKETLESPLFPSIGEDSLRGLFLKWSLPFYVNEGNYGAILVDYFSRFQEVGLGAVLRYAVGGQEGRVRLYSFPARVGDSRLEISLDHALSLGGGWQAGGKLGYEAVGSSRSLSFSFSLGGTARGWRVSLAAERSRREEDEVVRTVERLPELALSHAAASFGAFSLSPRLAAGWVREWVGDALVGQSLRFDGSVEAAFPSVSFLGLTAMETAGLHVTLYATDEGSRSRAALSFSSSVGSPGMRVAYSGQLVSGTSPFEHDKAVSASRLTWRFSGEAGPAVAVEGGLDLLSGAFDPLLVTLAWGQTSSFGLVARCDLATGNVAEVKLSGRWKADGFDAAWEVPYLPSLVRFDPAAFQVRATTGGAKVTLRGEIDPTAGKLSRASVEAEVRSETGWGITASASYTSGSSGLISPGLGAFRDLYDCLRLGFEREAGQTWVYVSVLAFPEAVLRYAPSGALALGSEALPR